MNLKTPCFATALTLCLSASLHAADWATMERDPAKIEVVNMQPVPLAASSDKKGWARVPEQLLTNRAVIYMPTGGTDGVADIKVIADGYLLVACNYDYQGNKSGKWDEEAWNEKKFKAKGWHLMSKNEVGGVLVKGDNRDQVILSKEVHRGETIRIRCNKYDPPYPILLGGAK
jgi:hypothetical protein